MRENEMDRGEGHDEVGKLDVFAIFALQVMEFLQWLASGDHVDCVHTHLADELLGHDDVETELLTKRVRAQLMV